MDRLYGQLRIQRRGPNSHPLIQVIYKGKSFNLASGGIAGELADGLYSDPLRFDGSEIEFEMVKGQPARVSLRCPAGTEQKSPASEQSSINVEVGLIQRFHIDSGTISPLDGGTVYFDDRAIRQLRLSLREGDAVAFTCDPKDPRNAKWVSLLSECVDEKVVRNCIDSGLPAYSRPVVRQFLRSLSPNGQRRWIAQNQKELKLCERWQWWEGVDAEVRESPLVIAVLPSQVAAKILDSAIRRVSALDYDGQSGWLRERHAFWNLIPSDTLGSLNPRILWDESCWKLLGYGQRARVIGQLVDDLSLEELLDRLDSELIDHLHEPVDRLVLRILQQSATDGLSYPITWPLVAQALKRGTFRAPVELWDTPALLGTICSCPELWPYVSVDAVAVSERLQSVRPLASFAASAPTPISGSTSFSTLDPEDFLLAAVYASIDQHTGAEFDRLFGDLTHRNEWAWENLRQKAARLDEHRWSEFLVKGVQPRVAELAFAQVHRGLGLKEDLIDLNRRALSSLRNWSLNAAKSVFLLRREELSEDWEDSVGRWRYDVKCNLYFRSTHSRSGLRGFCVNIEHEARDNRPVVIAGVVFYESSGDGCSWSFVGLLTPSRLANEASRAPRSASGSPSRVAPFFFRVPNRHRISEENFLSAEHAAKLSEFLAATRNSTEPGSRAGLMPPIIPTLTRNVCSLGHLSRSERLLAKSFQDARVRCDGSVKLERLLWEGLTNLVFDARSSGEQESLVAASLNDALALIESMWLPVILPTAEAGPLLVQWIHSVLTPLNSNWNAIRCPRCNRSGAGLKIEPQTSSVELAVRGNFECTCGHRAEDVTLLTHCYRCHQYPLIIGQNRVCWECGGLCCRGSEDRTCDACKCGRDFSDFTVR